MMQSNPSFQPNQLLGAFSRANLMAYGTAVLGVGLGFLTADVVDRIVATRRPADAESGAKANNPWYGRDAAAAQRMRPDAWRLAAQGIGAVVALGLAYWSRGRRVIPWLLGGTAVGFGTNLFKMLADWWIMPLVLKSEPTEASWGNRLYPLEQTPIQDQVATIFARWDQTDSLNEGQQATPNVRSPLADSTAADVYTLGRQQPQRNLPGRHFMNTGRLGNCSGCGGHNGCWNDCPTQCPDCPGYNPNKRCMYVVQAGDDIVAIASQGGVSINDVAAMNGGRTSFAVGESVVLPYGACLVVNNRMPIQPVAPPGYLPVQPIVPTTTTSVPGFVPVQPIVPGAYVPPVVAGTPAVQQPHQGNGKYYAPAGIGLTDEWR